MAELSLMNSSLKAIIDDEDSALVAGFRWRLSGEGYVVASSRENGSPRLLLLHRLVVRTPDGLETDHINTDRLDNRRTNLRPATKSQNQGNRRKLVYKTSRYKGVSWYARDGCWAAKGPKKDRSGNWRQGHLGYFAEETGAAKAYNRAAFEHGGTIALLNPV